MCSDQMAFIWSCCSGVRLRSLGRGSWSRGPGPSRCGGGPEGAPSCWPATRWTVPTTAPAAKTRMKERSKRVLVLVTALPLPLRREVGQDQFGQLGFRRGGGAGGLGVVGELSAGGGLFPGGDVLCG